MQNVAIRNSHLLRDKICKHISQNYNLIIVHIQSAHDERVRRARTTLTIIGLVLIESAIVLISRARTCSRGCKPEKKWLKRPQSSPGGRRMASRSRVERSTPRRNAVSSISFVTTTSAMIVASIVLSLWRQMAMRESVWFLGFSPVSKRKKDVPRGVRIVFCSSFVGVFFFIYFM